MTWKSPRLIGQHTRGADNRAGDHNRDQGFHPIPPSKVMVPFVAGYVLTDALKTSEISARNFATRTSV